MVVGRIAGEAFTDGDVARLTRHGIKLVAIGDIESAHLKSADETNKPGSKEQSTSGIAHRPLPSRNEVAPEKWKTDKVSPNNQLDVIPAPWRDLNKEGEKKDREGRGDEGKGIGESTRTGLSVFPDSPADHAEQSQNGERGDAKVIEPETRDRRDR